MAFPALEAILHASPWSLPTGERAVYLTPMADATLTIDTALAFVRRFG